MIKPFAFIMSAAVNGHGVPFTKYQAMGNDFLIFEQTTVSQRVIPENWPLFISRICNRRLGVGADGLLVIDVATPYPHVSVFNQDGSPGQFSGNGARCAAYHLMRRHHFANVCFLTVGTQRVRAEMTENNGFHLVTIATVAPLHIEAVGIKSAWGNHQGFSVNVGNPHLLLFEEKSDAWIAQHGNKFETCFGENSKINVEWVWPDVSEKNVFHMRIFERGVGPSQSCCSGVAAAVAALYSRVMILPGIPCTIRMPGGNATATFSEQPIFKDQLSREHTSGSIHITAPVEYVFDGMIIP